MTAELLGAKECIIIAAACRLDAACPAGASPRDYDVSRIREVSREVRVWGRKLTIRILEGWACRNLANIDYAAEWNVKCAEE